MMLARMPFSPLLYKSTLVSLVLSFITHLSKPISAKAQTQTQWDDADSFFTWTGNWNVATPSKPCHACDYQPDPSQMFDQTWHEGGTDGRAGGSIQFNGTEIYIYGADKSGMGSVFFSLDGGSPAVHTTYSTGRWIYNETFFSATNLSPDEMHEVIFTLDGIVILDSAIVINDIPQTNVTTTTSSPTTTVTSPPSAITVTDLVSISSSGFHISKTSSSSNSFSSALSVLSSPEITAAYSSSSSAVSDSISIPSSTDVSSSESPKATQSAAVHGNINTAAIGIGVSSGVVAILAGAILLYRNRRKKILQAQEEDSHQNQSTDNILSEITSQSPTNTHDKLDQAVERRETLPSVIDIRRFTNLSPQEMLVEYRRMQLLRAQDFSDHGTTGSRYEELPAYYDGRQGPTSVHTSTTLTN